MPKLKEGDRVRVADREVTPEDRTAHRYYPHMAGLTGTVQNVYETGELAVKVDPHMLLKVARDVHETAVDRMRAKFLNAVSEEQKKQLTKEELEFGANYVILVRATDLERIAD